MRLIDADAFERAVMFSGDEDLQDVIYRLRDFPTIETEERKKDWYELIRCKDCKYYIDSGCRCYRFDGLRDLRSKDDFCSFAKKIEVSEDADV